MDDCKSSIRAFGGRPGRAAILMNWTSETLSETSSKVAKFSAIKLPHNRQIWSKMNIDGSKKSRARSTCGLPDCGAICRNISVEDISGSVYPSLGIPGPWHSQACTVLICSSNLLKSLLSEIFLPRFRIRECDMPLKALHGLQIQKTPSRSTH
jgi:hypothetical protein